VEEKNNKKEKGVRSKEQQTGREIESEKERERERERDCRKWAA